jgi:hypothetical protein
MWFNSRSETTISNSSPLISRNPVPVTVTTTAPINQLILRQLDYVAPIAIIATGGSVSSAAGFRIHTFTTTGNSELVFTRL